MLDRLPEASDFSQRVRHLNSVSREAETLIAACARHRGGYATEDLNGGLDLENVFMFTQNTLECPHFYFLGRSWSDCLKLLRAT